MLCFYKDYATVLKIRESGDSSRVKRISLPPTYLEDNGDRDMDETNFLMSYIPENSGRYQWQNSGVFSFNTIKIGSWSVIINKKLSDDAGKNFIEIGVKRQFFLE